MKKLLLTAAIFIAFFTLKLSAQITDPFFEHVDYRGAFGTTDWTSGWTNWNPQNTNYGTPDITVSGDITTNTTWTASHTYLLSGFVYIKSGVTITIEPGTVIQGDKTSKGTLIIEKGAKINAIGTSSNPIIFTSNVAAGSRDYGDWGGIILCGKAQINVPGDSALIEGGPTSYYGGAASPENTDNSGSLKYIRIEYPGVPLQPNQEINGLTMGGVGSGTSVDYVQVSYSGDDSYEWFGGTVSPKHLIAFRGQDDDFDTDYGYTGKLQFLVSLRDPNWADVSGSNGFESDNDASGSTNTPQTKPTFSNVSVFGPKVTSSTSINSNYKRALHIRRNSALNVYNSIFAGFPTGLYIDGTASQGNANSGLLNIENSVIAGMGAFFDVPTGGTWTAGDERAWFLFADRENDTIADNSSLMISDPFNLSAPNFKPLSGSQMLIGSIWYVSGISETGSNVVSKVAIYPNPCKESVNISLTLTESSKVKIELYDISGRLISATKETSMNEGTQEIKINTQDINKGFYFVNISASGNKISQKLIVQ